MIAFCGGDGYYSDQPVSPAATLNRYFLGARTIYSVHLGGVEPAQAVAAQYAWNADAPGAAEIAGGRAEALAQLAASQSGVLRPPEVYGQGGLLEAACGALYGAEAGPLVAEALRGDGARWPVVAIWPSFSREVRALSDGRVTDHAERAEHWRARGEVTLSAARKIGDALELASETSRDDLRWLHERVRLGSEFCDLLARAWESRASGGGADEVADAWQALAMRLRNEAPSGYVDPLGGDITGAIEIAEGLANALRSGYSPS